MIGEKSLLLSVDMSRSGLNAGNAHAHDSVVRGQGHGGGICGGSCLLVVWD